jgi:hypothetical protein
MSMAITFDTLRYANTLKAAGVKPEFAEAHAKAEAEVFAETLTDQVATKYDINMLEAKIDQVKNELIIKLGGIVVAVGGLLGALIAIFHVVG